MSNFKVIDYEDLTDNGKVLFNNRIYFICAEESDNLIDREFEEQLVVYPDDLLN